MIIAVLGSFFSCSKTYFEVEPQGRASLTQLSNKNGVTALLIGAYSLLDGVGAGNTGRQSTISNYVFGGISSDDAVKGTDAGDQPEQSFIEQYSWLAVDGRSGAERFCSMSPRVAFAKSCCRLSQRHPPIPRWHVQIANARVTPYFPRD